MGLVVSGQWSGRSFREWSVESKEWSEGAPYEIRKRREFLNWGHAVLETIRRSVFP